jgi:hypothetical protein
MGLEDIERLLATQTQGAHPLIRGLVDGLAYEQKDEDTLPVSISNLGKFCYARWDRAGRRRRK